MPKTYLLTGATSGMGRAVAENLLAAGHRVLALVRAGSARQLPQGVEVALQADLADLPSLETALQGFTTPLDGVIYAAGILPGQSYTEMPLATLQEVFAINTLAPIVLLKHLQPNLQAGGCVVLFGSISGHKGSYDDAYAASKGAVHSLVRSLALKLAPAVRVVGIAPGMIEDTGMTAALVPGRLEHTRKLIPLGMGGHSADIAELVAFVLSPAAAFMTGAVLDINGGQYLRS